MDADIELLGPAGESIATGTDGDDTFPDLSNIGPLDAGNYTLRVRHENPQTDAAGMGWWYRMTIYQTGYTVNE